MDIDYNRCHIIELLLRAINNYGEDGYLAPMQHKTICHAKNWQDMFVEEKIKKLIEMNI